MEEYMNDYIKAHFKRTQKHMDWGASVILGVILVVLVSVAVVVYLVGGV